MFQREFLQFSSSNQLILSIIKNYRKLLIISPTAILVGFVAFFCFGSLRNSKSESVEDVKDYYTTRGEFIHAKNLYDFESIDDSLSIEDRSSLLALSYIKSESLKRSSKYLSQYLNKRISLNNQREDNINEFLNYLNSELKDYPKLLNRFRFQIMENVKDPRKKFRIMQWNGLAKKLCINTIKYKSQVEAINWEKFRMWRLLQEITRYNSDIICLQEADFYDDIKPYLHDLGYSSVFVPKCAYVGTIEEQDGCVIFYHTGTFQIRKFKCQNVGDSDCQVYIVMQLEHRHSKQRISILCAHLKAFDEFQDRRTYQTEVIIENLKMDEHVLNEPLIICGDFNGEHTEPFYKLITNDQLLKLSDAYFDERKKDNGNFSKNVDYIFYTNSNLKLIDYLETRFYKKNSFGYPNFEYPSDHLSIVCDFQFV